MAEDFPAEVDGGVAEHNSILQCPSAQDKCTEYAKAQDGTSDLFPSMYASSYSVVATRLAFRSHSHDVTGIIGVRAPLHLGRAVTVLPEKNYTMPESMCCTNALKSAQ